MALSPRNRLLLFAVLLIGMLCWISLFSADKQLTCRADWTYSSGFDPHGGYLDRVTFVVYPTGDIGLALQALQSGAIYAYDENIPGDFIPAVQEAVASSIQVRTEAGDMYRMFAIDCERFPTNITGYRRAFAYALDKGAVIQASTGGLAFFQDCALPISLGNWTFEYQLQETYYAQNILKANTTLEASGFRDLNGDGWRDYDVNNNHLWDAGIDLNSSEFVVEISHTAGHAPSGNASTLAAEGLAKCGILTRIEPIEYYSMLEMLDYFDPWISCFSFTDMMSVDRLFKLFHNSTSNSQWYFGGWTNATYNRYAENLMAAQTKEEANHWAWKCQEILWYEQPMIVCYNDVYTHAFQTDFWEGYVNMACRNRMGNNPWTLRHLRLKEDEGGPWSCFPTEYILSLTEGLDTTNLLMSKSQHAQKVFSQIYSRLWQFDPFTWEPVPDLAHNWVIEQTNASGDIQKGQKITFNLYPNVTWHDGLPLSSTDVKYSLELYQQFDYTYALVFGNIYRIDTLGPNTVIVYTNRSGYFEFMHATNLCILPKHIWELPDNLTTWVPTVPQMIGTGPYKITNYLPDEYVVIERHPDWHFAVEMAPRTPCPYSGPSFLLIGYIGIIVIVIQVMILGYLLLRQSRKNDLRKSKANNSTRWRVD